MTHCCSHGRRPWHTIGQRKAVRHGANRGGFTLLEVILALSLTVVVFSILALAINLYMRLVDKGRLEVEQAQLARAVLGRVAEDLKSTIRGVKIDTSTLKAMAQSSAANSASQIAGQIAGAAGASGQSSGGNSQGQSGGNSGGNSQGGNSNSNSNSKSNSSSSSNNSKSGNQSGQSNSGQSNNNSNSSNSKSGGSSSNSSNSSSGQSGSQSNSSQNSQGSSTSGTPSTSTTPPDVPGLYGTQYELQIDVSRLPRADELGLTSDPNQAAIASMNPPHDVRTVGYYVAGAGASGNTSNTGGLIRRQLDRAAAVWSNQQGSTDAPGTELVNLSNEVTAVSFRYLDGTSWITEWDSSVTQRLPNAVEVSVEIAPPAQQGNALDSLSRSVFQSQQSNRQAAVYRLVVYLPAAATTAEASTMTDSSQDSSQNSSSQSSGSNSSSGNSSGGGASGANSAGT